MKKAQIWSTDVMIAVIIFSIGIMVFLIYSINYGSEAEESFEKLTNDGDFIFSNILSSGYPDNWDENNVIRIGIINEQEINQEKLEYFYYLSENNYEKTKAVFNTIYDYYFFIDDQLNINSTPIDGIGKPGVSRDNLGETQNLVKLKRVSIYEKKPVMVYLYVWN